MNIEAVTPSIYQTTEYINLSEALLGNDELQSYADEYFRGMTMPSIPNEKGTCVYYTDWNGFLRWVNWKLQNTNILDTNEPT